MLHPESKITLNSQNFFKTCTYKHNRILIMNDMEIMNKTD